MAERIDKVINEKDSQNVDFKTNLFYNGPVEFLVKRIAIKLKSIDVFKQLFADEITGYMRMDFSIRSLPAIRVYNGTYDKLHESHYIEGQIKLDIIFPPNLRRDEVQQMQDTVSGAIVQQFRRPLFFLDMCEEVPGLNELGKTINVNKEMGFMVDEQEAPLTQIILNFRLDLKVWDDYLEKTDRTKDTPFEESIGDLKKIIGTIQGLREDNATVEVDEELIIDTRE